MSHSTRRRRSALSVGLVAVVVAALLEAGGPTATAAPSPKVVYGYDAAGRLVSVTDTAGAKRSLTYDAVGNLLTVTNGAAGATSRSTARPAKPVISTVATDAAATAANPAAATVTVTGSHLPDATSARVRVGGLYATVVASSADRLTAEIPPGLPGGTATVSVTGPGGTATASVTIPGSATPAATTDADDLPSLTAASGRTAVSGRVRDSATGDGIGGVGLSVDGVSTVTRPDGRFLLSGLEPGHHELEVDGAHPTSGIDHGVYEVGVDAVAGTTTPMTWPTWLTAVDTAHAVRLPAHLTHELVVTNPAVPGIEVHVPAGTTLTGHDGKRVTSLSVTSVPTDRQPFPGAPGMPFAWTVQPGDAHVSGPGLYVVYPNLMHQRPGTTIDYVDHDADRGGQGWAVYGHGTVDPSGTKVIPDATTRLHETYQLGVAYQILCLLFGLFCPPPGDDTKDGDPVNLQTGLFVMSHSDLAMPDVVPIALTRTYRQNDGAIRSFGIGQSDAFNSFVAPDRDGNYVVQFPDGSSVPFAPDPDGVTYRAVATPTGLTGATLTGDDHRNFTVHLVDGSQLVFGGYTASLVETDDRYGNAMTLARDSSGRVNRVTSPNGRWISLTWGTCSTSTCITGARDNSGRRVAYAYDADGRMTSVTDPAGKITRYTWADCSDGTTCTELIKITDPMNVAYLTNEFDDNGRVRTQTQADRSTFTFGYTLDGDGRVTATTTTDPRGNVRQVTFDGTGYPVSDTAAVGTPQEQTTTMVRDDAHRVTSSTDALGRVTTTTYDDDGDVMAMTQLAGTPQAVTQSFTYEPTYQRMATATNGLGKSIQFTYDDTAGTVSVTDALGHTETTREQDGEPVSTTDGLGHTSFMSYLDGDPVASTDALGRTSHNYYDAAGRLLRSQDPLGNTVQYRYDALNQVVAATDPLGAVSSATYDANGNLLTASDRLTHVTTYTYDRMNRLATRKDALGATETYTYDLSGNVVSHTDRNGSVTRYKYDALDRPTFAGFGATGPNTYQSTTTDTYDAGDRVTRAVDTAGTLNWTYDGFDRVTKEATPLGSVSYAYDKAGRRTRMTVGGQPATTYTYDDDDELTAIKGGTGTVSFGYDAAKRRTSIKLPGTTELWTYDDASQVTAISYRQGSSTIGNLTYGYDDAGRKTSVGGTYARSDLPALVASSTYNADNALTARGTSSFSYDAEGQLLTDGASTYTWNARHQMSSLTGAATAAFTYDALGRRQSRTVNGTATGYLYDGVNTVQEKTGTTVSANLLTGFGADETYLRSDASTTKALLTDVQGSTVALVPAGGGATTTTYAYDPWGVTRAVGAASTNPTQYTGRENDGTGLYYYRARYYNPSLQRFVSQDPAGEAGSGDNLYAYVGSSPTNGTDPSGMLFGADTAIGCGVGAAIEVGFHWAQNKTSGRKYTWRDAGVDALKGCVIGAASTLIGPAAAKGADLFGSLFARRAGSKVAAEAADDWPVISGIVRDAAQSKGNFGLGSGSASQAFKAGESWVGEGYRIASDGKTLVSRDGLRTFRPPTWKPNEGKYQANFEYWIGERKGEPFGNGHLDITGIDP